MSTKHRGVALIFFLLSLFSKETEKQSRAWRSSLHWDPCLLETLELIQGN